MNCNDKLIALFKQLFTKFNIPKNWIKLETYMFVNNIQIKKSYPFDNLLTGCFYKNGVILKRNGNIMTFISYTLYDKHCVLNHISNHSLDGSYIYGKLNTFFDISAFKKIEGTKYVCKYLKEIINDTSFVWDIIEVKN